MKAWLKFFRVVNIPTVPGDVLVGASVVAACMQVGLSSPVAFSPTAILFACVASSFLYLYGLADNDIVGVVEDGAERPIPAGEISLGMARIARGLCLAIALAAGLLSNLPPAWWVAAFVIAASSVIYNRRKWCAVMGICRGANVIFGGAVLLPRGCPFGHAAALVALTGASLVWLLYIAVVTKYSEGESTNPEKRRRVGFLVGAIVYLQLAVLLLSYQLVPSLATRDFLLAGAGLLVALRLMKRFLPEVSAS